MPLSEKTEELRRLIQAFESEAGKFHPLTFSLFYVKQEGGTPPRPVARPNHGIMLWQYYGAIERDGGLDRFSKNVVESDLKWGLRGAELSCMGILEGEAYDLFVRMAQRAGSLFDESEARLVKSRTVEELRDSERARGALGKLAVAVNDNPLAIWLNYLLFHLSISNPGRERVLRINPDPFTLSLLALERLYAERSIEKVDKSTQPISELRFKVALSFAGERRPYVSATVDALRSCLPPDSVFYDFDYQAQLARPNLDVLLQDIYLNRSDLLVVFLSKDYADKEWCGLELRAIRDLIKRKSDDKIMFVRLDDAQVEGIFSIDGYVDAKDLSAQNLGLR